MRFVLASSALGTSAQTGDAVLIGCMAREDDFGEVWVLAVNERKKLKPVDDRHLDIQHHQINGLILQKRQCRSGGFRKKRLPQIGAGLFDDGGESLQKGRFIVNEQNAFGFGADSSHDHATS